MSALSQAVALDSFKSIQRSRIVRGSGIDFVWEASAFDAHGDLRFCEGATAEEACAALLKLLGKGGGA